MDAVDMQIIEMLKGDGRATFSDIARRIKLSESSVRRRVRTLVSAGVIRRFTLELDSGRQARAITLVNVTHGYSSSDLTARLKAISGVEEVHEITGQYDIAVLVACPSIGELNRCVDDIRRVDGVSNTNTMIILRTVS